MSEKLRTIATDWDGTFTDPVAMEEEYRMIVTDYLEEKLGINGSELGYAMAVARDVVLAAPEQHPWMVDGHLAAYPTDHYLVVAAATAIVMKQLEGRVESEKAKIVAGQLFAECSPKLMTICKPEAKEVMTELLRQVDVVVITNSSTGKVQAEVEALLGGSHEGNLWVKGGAKKMMIDPSFAKMPEPFRGMYGFPHAVDLRRPYYFTVLAEVFGDLHRARMMGDNGLLDLALVDYGDGKTGLVTSELSMPWEKKYWSHLPRRMAGSLAEVAEWIVK